MTQKAGEVVHEQAIRRLETAQELATKVSPAFAKSKVNKRLSHTMTRIQEQLVEENLPRRFHHLATQASRILLDSPGHRC